MKSISEMTPAEAAGIRYILMDIDDTITMEGKLLASSYAALWKLQEAGLTVIPVTGRPAGWCDLIAREWPVDGVVGENGALVFWEESAGNAVSGEAVPGAGNTEARYGDSAARRPRLRTEYHPGAVRNDHPALGRIRERALAEFPLLRDAKDQFARLFDIALDFAEEEPVLPLSTAERVREIALEEGAMAKVSSIHVNIWMGNYDKLSMAEHFLKSRFGWQPGAGDREVVFVGDSPNDEPMFARFPLACAVANIRRYGGLIRHYPAFAAEKECGEGFAEIAEIILEKRR
ncbi:MAG: HAD-IIB family hydrolase [Treponema sp.]|jgi:HAD superfamily hydrolase (TIGR01484 family)|nr:HAD-IIB family hydrolase [Treponema sp.]